MKAFFRIDRWRKRLRPALRLGREVLLVMLLGIAAFLTVYALKDYSFIGDEELGMRDRTQAIRADTETTSVAPPFVLIDFDQKDYAARGYPLTFPRDVLASVLEYAAGGKPLLIVVDVDLGLAKEQALLLPVLQRLSKAGSPPVLLVRSPLQTGEEGAPDIVLPTALDATVEGANNLAWVSALTEPDGDGIARRYSVSRVVHRGGRRLNLPGVQLAACAVLDKTAPRAVVQAAERGDALSCAGHDWPLGQEDATSEIDYTMSWRLREGTRRPQLDLPGSDAQVEEIEVLDALALTDAANLPPASALFAGRVVIIGSSADHAADIHRTSIGEMPGMMVIANAIRSARQNGPVARDGMLLSLLVTAFMSFLTWLVWRLIRRIRLSHLVFKDAAAPIMNLGWLFVITALLPAAHCETFLYPQIIVALFLVIVQGIREGREEHPTAPPQAPQQGDAS